MRRADDRRPGIDHHPDSQEGPEVTLTRFDPTQAREGLTVEMNYYPHVGGSLDTTVDQDDGALGLTVEDWRNPKSVACVWLNTWRSAELHLWLTAVIAADVLDCPAPCGYDPDGLEDGRRLNAVYDPENRTSPVTITVVGVDGAGNEGVEACLRLTEDEVQALHPLLTVVLLRLAALA